MTAHAEPFRYRSLAQHRRAVLVESGLVIGSIALAVWLVNRNIPEYWHLDRALSLTVAFVIVQTALIALLTGAMFGLKLKTSWRQRKAGRAAPLIVEKLTAISSGEVPPAALEALYRTEPRAVNDLLFSSLSAQRGSRHQRLAEAAAACGAVRAWKAALCATSPSTRCEAILRLATLPKGWASAELLHALNDVEELVAVEAGRAILAEGGVAEAERVFDSLPLQSVLVRALSVASLRQHAGQLALRVIPEALSSSTEGRVLVALGAIATWKRLLPLESIRAVLSHPAAEVRTAAFQALPFALCLHPFHTELREGFRDPVERVRAAAAIASRRKADPSLLPSLRELMFCGGEAGREAALALSAFGEPGIVALETAVLSGGPVAACATESLERYRLGRTWM